MTDDKERIATLEREIENLKSRLVAAGVPLPPKVDLPDADKIDRLIALCEHSWPRLKCPDNEREPIAAHRAGVMVACIAAGVDYAPPTHFPHDCAVALATYGVGSIRPLPLAWRGVLSSGQLPSPTALQRERTLLPSDL